MKKVAIYGQPYTVHASDEIQLLLASLEAHQIVVFIEENFYHALEEHKLVSKKYPTFANASDLNNSFDLLFSLGGDGTILRAVTYVRDLGIPLLGINTGRLGFLATVKKDAIPDAISFLIKKEYTIQERTLLSVSTSPNIPEISAQGFALNEVTIARKNTTSMIGVKTYLNKEYLTNYWSDGLIIATPTGSTGYSLSCQGPVISPNSKNFVITPIAPHNLNARPMVIPDSTTLRLEIESREKEVLISLDSRIITLPRDTKIHLKKASFTIKTIIPKNQSFLNTLRSKLLWGEDTRNQSNH